MTPIPGNTWTDRPTEGAPTVTEQLRERERIVDAIGEELHGWFDFGEDGDAAKRAYCYDIAEYVADAVVAAVTAAEDDEFEDAQAIIEEYRRQQAAHGIVEVSAADAQTTALFAIDSFKMTYKNGTTPVLDAMLESFARVYEAGRSGRLAATQEEA